MLTDPSFRTAQALVIDGNATMRRAVIAQLRELGVEKVQQCKGLVDAKALLEQVIFDFVLCADLIEGSELTGQSLLEELRREMTLPHSTVFVMMAGEATYATVVEAAEAALDCFLLRPFRINSLAERLIVARRRKLALGTILAALDAGHPAQALSACLQRYQANGPFALHCARMAAEILLQTGRIDEALALFRRVDQAQQPSWAQLGIARALFAQGDTDGASQQVTALLARQPSMVDAYDVLGRVQLEQGALLDAMRTHTTVAEMTPGCILRMQQCGTLAFFVGDQALASRMLERAVSQGLSSRLFDGLTLLLLAFVRHDAGDTRRLATSQTQVQLYAKTFPNARRLQRFEIAANALRVLLARQLDEARSIVLALAADVGEEDFDLEAATLVLALWSRLPVRDIAAGQQERLVRGIAMRFCVSKVVTEILVAAAQRNPTVSATLRACHDAISELADAGQAGVLQGQTRLAVRELLDQGANHRNARLIELAVALARQHLAVLDDGAVLLAEAEQLQARFCRPITHLAGVRRSGRAPGGLLLRGQRLRPTGPAQPTVILQVAAVAANAAVTAVAAGTAPPPAASATSAMAIAAAAASAATAATTSVAAITIATVG